MCDSLEGSGWHAGGWKQDGKRTDDLCLIGVFIILAQKFIQFVLQLLTIGAITLLLLLLLLLLVIRTNVLKIILMFLSLEGAVAGTG